MHKEDSKAFEDNDILYDSAPFGKFPYDKQIIGQLIQPDPGLNLCSDFAKKDLHLKNKNQQVFLLVEKAECSEKLIAFYAEKAGVMLVIFKKSDDYDSKIILHKSQNQNNLTI